MRDAAEATTLLCAPAFLLFVAEPFACVLISIESFGSMRRRPTLSPMQGHWLRRPLQLARGRAGVWLHWTCALYSPQVAHVGEDADEDQAAHAAALAAGADAKAVSSW